MKAKNRIKIVKRAERDDESKIEKSRPQTAVGAQNPTQKVARQVASWVKEFELRRRTRTGRSFASLFREPDLESAS